MRYDTDQFGEGVESRREKDARREGSVISAVAAGGRRDIHRLDESESESETKRK